MKILYIGLGRMGGPMAAHLVKAGFDVTVYNRTHSKSVHWQADYPEAAICQTLSGIM